MAVKIQMMTIPGAPLEGTNPLPIFHKKNEVNVKMHPDFPDKLQINLGNRSPVLPYKMQDRYSRKHIPLKKKAIVLENEYLIATFWPEDGGRLYSLFDKVHQTELLMSNPVYQPCNLALRNAWLSGGIEWNFGTYGHNARTCDHVFAAVLKDPEGNDFLRMFEYDRTKNALYQMDFHLPADSPVLYNHVKLFNPFDEDTTAYWWTNIAIPEDGNTRVLSSSEWAMVLGGADGVTYEKLPEISLFPGKDLSYPHHATRGFDYFFQVPEDTKTAWEAGAYSDGLIFFDCSTAPLLYHKMFCWGNHAAGKHWQEFLSVPGDGYYVEIQGGIAPSQIHDQLFPAHTTIEWTQCFGGMKLEREQLHQPDFHAANIYLGGHIDAVISEKELLHRNKLYSEYALIPVQEKKLVHLASGWGALEKIRMEKEGKCSFPESVCFPVGTIGPEQHPWYVLLMEGKLPDASPEQIPVSWMVSEKWMKLLENSLENGGETWYSLLHYGVMLGEMMDRSHTAYEASRWGKYSEYRELARRALEKSVTLRPSVWALRCLGWLANEEDNDVQTEKYYDWAFTLPEVTVDFSLAAEYMKWLNSKKKYEKAWALYQKMPVSIQNAERMLLNAAQTAIKLREMDTIEKIFSHGEYADVREGECSLTDIWFEYCAVKLARERGIENPQGDILNQLIEEAWDRCPPPYAIDFRMSYDRKKKYRMEE